VFPDRLPLGLLTLAAFSTPSGSTGSGWTGSAGSGWTGSAWTGSAGWGWTGSGSTGSTGSDSVAFGPTGSGGAGADPGGSSPADPHAVGTAAWAGEDGQVNSSARRWNAAAALAVLPYKRLSFRACRCVSPH